MYLNKDPVFDSCGKYAIFAYFTLLFELRPLIFLNRICNKILDGDWFSTSTLSRNRRAITWVFKYRYPISTFVIGFLYTAGAREI